jgi:hypothetical protein
MKKHNVKDLLAEKYTGAHMKKMVRIASADAKLFKDLSAVFTGKDEELARRASWPIGYIAAQQTEMSTKYIGKYIQLLKQQNRHPSIYRNTFRILQNFPLPEKYKAEVYDLALRYIQNAVHPGSIRAFAMSAALNAGKEHSELIHELKIVLEALSGEETPAIRSRANTVLKQIARMETTHRFNK